MTNRTYILPSAEQTSSYARAILAAPTSLIPGMSGVESVAAMSYVRTLPMRRGRSITEAWLSLTDVQRGEWVSRASDLLADA